MAGRHRKPSDHKALRAATIGTVGGGLLLATTGTGTAATPQETLNAIAQCESSGRPSVTGYSGKHFGLFQFDLRTWASVGGKGNPANASPTEQNRRASMLLAKRGTQPWDASKDCWSKEVSSAPKRDSNSIVVKRGNTLSDIAAAHNTTWQEIYHLNRDTISNPNVISVGMILRLP
jgi:nucleoid-associated protein YgaU